MYAHYKSKMVRKSNKRVDNITSDGFFFLRRSSSWHPLTFQQNNTTNSNIRVIIIQIINTKQ